MVIQKETKFYASHRNQELEGKCWNLHGHQYGVVFHFDLTKTAGSSITTLFSELESSFKDVIEAYDHAALWDVKDPLYHHIYSNPEFASMKCVLFDGPTSVENLCFKLFAEVFDNNRNLCQLDVRETSTSVVRYSFNDFCDDLTTMFGLDAAVSARNVKAS